VARGPTAPHVSDKGGEQMVLILFWLLGAPLALIILLFLLGVGH
jgi:hypothetical protein